MKKFSKEKTLAYIKKTYGEKSILFTENLKTIDNLEGQPVIELAKNDWRRVVDGFQYEAIGKDGEHFIVIEPMIQEVRFVISHKLQEKTTSEILLLIDENELYLQKTKIIFNGKKTDAIGWGDLFEADKFETKEEVEAMLDSLPMKHTIIEIEI